MSYAKKVLGNSGDRNIGGLISSLRKTSPGVLARMQDSGGRIMGAPMADDQSGKQIDPNGSRITFQKKC